MTKKPDDKKKGCCGRGRKMSSTTIDEGSQFERTVSLHMGDTDQPFGSATHGTGTPYHLNAQEVTSPFPTHYPAPGPPAEMYQKFSKVRKTNYVTYTPPVTIAERFNHPGYKETLEAEVIRQQQNSEVPAVWPLPGAAPIRTDRQTISSADESTNKIRIEKSRGRTLHSRNDRRRNDDDQRSHSVSYEESRHRHRLTSSTASMMSSNSRQSDVCRYCNGTGRVKDHRGLPSACGDCHVKKPKNKSYRRKEYSPSSFPKHGGSYETQSSFLDVNNGDDDQTIHKYRPTERGEKDCDYGYHIRKHFFDASKMIVPEKGSDMKMLPQYSVSYKNFPSICYDVVVPTSNKDFYRVRKSPGFA